MKLKTFTLMPCWILLCLVFTFFLVSCGKPQVDLEQIIRNHQISSNDNKTVSDFEDEVVNLYGEDSRVLISASTTYNTEPFQTTGTDYFVQSLQQNSDFTYNRKNEYVKLAITVHFYNADDYDELSRLDYAYLFSIDKNMNVVAEACGSSVDGEEYELRLLDSEYDLNTAISDTMYHIQNLNTKCLADLDLSSKQTKDLEIDSSSNNDSDIPFSLSNLGAVKNSDGTISFNGYITEARVSSSATIYITALNGNRVSTGADYVMPSLYQNPYTGEIGNLISDLARGNYAATRILFEFIFDSSGNLIELRQVR